VDKETAHLNTETPVVNIHNTTARLFRQVAYYFIHKPQESLWHCFSQWDTPIWWDLKVGCVGSEVSKIRISVKDYVMKYVVYNCRNTVFENEKLCFYCGLITGF
jgi:hypothetical protein